MTSLVQSDSGTAAAPAPSLADTMVGRRYLQLVLVLGSLSAIGPLTVDTYLPALPQLTAEFRATDSQAQLTITGLLLGLGLGQLLIGPLSDAVGRRKPLLIGLIGHGLMSVLCALAPSIVLLSVTRTLQGLAGAAVAVVAMAVVRDLFTGIRAAQLLSRLILVLGVAPIVAPSLGSALLKFTDWQGIFVVLAAAAVVLLAVAWFGLPETLPPSRRRPASVASSLAAYRQLLTDRSFVTMVLVAGLMFATLFAYISGAPFILQGIYGLSPQQFGFAFSANAVGLILMTQINPILVRRQGPVRILSVAIATAVLSSLALLACAVTGFGGILGFLIPLFFIVSAAGLSFPNAPAIALSRYGESAGTAAALLGAAQFMVGGLIAPLVGVLANGTTVPLAAVMVGTTALAGLLFLGARRGLNAISYE